MSVRLYTRTVGHGSLAVVGRGFELALRAAGKLDGVYPIDRAGGSSETTVAPGGAQAEVAVFVGPLNEVRAMQGHAKHQRHHVLISPNSNYIPQNLLAEIVRLPGAAILSPSHWATRVIVCALGPMRTFTGAFPVDVLHAPLGISGLSPHPESIELARAAYADGEFRVLHFSTTEGERKGTLELAQAWALLMERRALPEKSKLILVLDYLAQQALLDRMGTRGMAMPPGMHLAPRANLPPEHLRITLGFTHLLCAPSRGEGFGLSPLEARACGVPIAATHVTGHSEGHTWGPGCVPIETGPDAPIDDGPAAMAPSLDPEAIVTALHSAYHEWRGMSESSVAAAPDVTAQWSWERQLERWVGSL